jgi:hypothetical protein
MRFQLHTPQNPLRLLLSSICICCFYYFVSTFFSGLTDEIVFKSLLLLKKTGFLKKYDDDKTLPVPAVGESEITPVLVTLMVYFGFVLERKMEFEVTDLNVDSRLDWATKVILICCVKFVALSLLG